MFLDNALGYSTIRHSDYLVEIRPLAAITAAEAIRLCHHLDIEPGLIIDLCGSGAAGSWALANFAHIQKSV
ncbi:MAG: hypothetical protein ACKN9E_00755 [Microcystaceae cyanobacterium]